MIGQKHDKQKPRMSLLPKGSLNAVIRVLEFGATKYKENNWKHVPDAKVRYYDAMQRHIEAWWSGEQKDPETGEHHLAHAICCGMFLWWFDDMDSKVMAGHGFAEKFVRKGDLEKIENCLHISTSMFHDDKAECFGCGAVVNHERKVIGVKRGDNA